MMAGKRTRVIENDMDPEAVQKLAYSEPLLLKQRWLEQQNQLENAWSIYRAITDSRNTRRPGYTADKAGAEVMIQSVTIKFYMSIREKLNDKEEKSLADLDAMIPAETAKLLKLSYLYQSYKVLTGVLKRLGIYSIERLSVFPEGRQLA